MSIKPRSPCGACGRIGYVAQVGLYVEPGGNAHPHTICPACAALAANGHQDAISNAVELRFAPARGAA